jgi:hypothetical protein
MFLLLDLLIQEVKALNNLKEVLGLNNLLKKSSLIKNLPFGLSLSSSLRV